jgi:hypothetical protein
MHCDIVAGASQLVRNALPDTEAGARYERASSFLAVRCHVVFSPNYAAWRDGVPVAGRIWLELSPIHRARLRSNPDSLDFDLARRWDGPAILFAESAE